MDLTTITNEFDALEPALVQIENVTAGFSIFLPAPVAAAIAELRVFQSVAPLLIQDIEKLIADGEAAYATLKAKQTT
jgi:hypothetical protein